MKKQLLRKLAKARKIAERCGMAGIDPPRWVVVLLKKNQGVFS